MAKKQPTAPVTVPSTEVRDRIPLTELDEISAAEIENRALTTTAVLHEILAQSDEGRYHDHWGINE